MRRSASEGHCRAYSMDGSFYTLARAHYGPCRAAWMAGQAFYDATGPYGEPLTVKLARVEAMSDLSADVCRVMLDEEEEDRRNRAITGDG